MTGRYSDVNVPPPFALSGASPSLHARHEEQRFLFLLESFEWLHWWHGHDEARRVADRTVGILLREGEREIGLLVAGSACTKEKIMKFLFMESILIFIRDLQYRVKFPLLTSIGGKAKEIPSCPWWNLRGHRKNTIFRK